MPRRFFELTMTPGVTELQRRTYGRSHAPQEPTGEPDRLTRREVEFLAERDSFYLGTSGEDGHPYVQHRGGPAGFLHVLDDRTLAFADFRGNRQLLSAGNVEHDPRVSLFLMDYPGRRRLKILGRATFLDACDAPALAAQVTHPEYDSIVERVVRIEVEAFDWNCPQHITQRFTAAEVEAVVGPLRERIAELETRLADRD